MKEYQIMAVELEDRKALAPKVQEVFTEFGDCILSRLGVHDPDENHGIITLNVKATDEYLEDFCSKLTGIPGVHVKRMKISH